MIPENQTLDNCREFLLNVMDLKYQEIRKRVSDLEFRITGNSTQNVFYDLDRLAYKIFELNNFQRELKQYE